MDLLNIFALVCRVITLMLLVYAMILSSKILSSCQFISAVSSNDETHGVGLQSFETDKQECIPHNAFIKEHYNGTEMAAKVGGYLAPSLASVVVLWLLAECCKKNGCWSGKCIPTLLMIGCIVAQSLTFLLFQSELFCGNDDIKECKMGSAAFTSVQACVVYVVTLIFYCAPNPKPLSNLAVGMGMMGANSSSGNTTASSSNSSKKEKKSKPDVGEDYTREMYEQRRREKKIKSRGVSGRSKKEIFNDLNGKSDQAGSARRDEEYDESQIILYDPETGGRDDDKKKSGRGSPQPRYDDYVDEPDGMDWSAYSPNEREEYYERKRSKKKQREREKKEQELQRLREREEIYGDEDDRRHYRDRPPSNDDGTFQSEYTKDQYDRMDDQYDRNGPYDNRDRGYSRDDRYEDSYRSSDYGYGKHDGYGKHNDSYYNDSYRSGDRRGSYNDYDDSCSYRSGQDDFSAYDSMAGDGYYDRPQDDDVYNERAGSGRGDDYSYGYDSRADDYYESPHSRRSDRGGYYS
eukprot:CCRYP_001820-RA/>CCRYP_001820-RA protein AED:0.07 eAED:0.07 QI:518/1/1/1/1/1/3/640/518